MELSSFKPNPSAFSFLFSGHSSEYHQLSLDCPHTHPEDILNGNHEQWRGGKGHAAHRE